MSRAMIIIVVLACAASVAAAQAPDRTVEAEQLFRDGQALMREGKTAEACAAFEGSQRMQENPGTLMNLAACRERNGQLASAWGAFLLTASQARANPATAAIATAARDRAAALEPRLSYLIINVPDDARVDGLEISRNGVVVDVATWNRAIPIDGGRYAIRAKVPGREPWGTEVTIAPERDKQSVDVPRLDPLPVATATERDVPVPAAPRAPAGMSGRRRIAIGVGAVTLASVAGAVVLELSARDQYDAYLYEPEGPGREALFDDAMTRRRIAQGLGVTAAAAGTAAAYLWITGKRAPGPRDTVVQLRVAAGSAGLVIGGGF